MQEDHEFILTVWREACRHIAIVEFADVLSRLLGAKLPLGRLIIRHIDPQTAHVVTVAEAPRPPATEYHKSHDRWEAEDLRGLLRWCCRGELKLRQAGGRSRHMALAAIPPSLNGDVLLAPLVSEHGVSGLVLMEARPPSRFTAAHSRIVQRLLEPLAVALENDHRLSELKTLREAAESDKRALLARLGRDDLSEDIIGAEQGLQAVMERVGLVSRSDVPVLLLGETGSGKEVIARAIHNRSAVNKGPFIRVNCGALPPELIDSELFGHEKGSFTGAASSRRGWFERADGGTLFLDEMGELPPAAQVRLLRVLHDGELDRVGGEEPIKVEVRIVAATHRDLAAMIQAGTFREDLWYRLAVFPIVLPPLRERMDDIPALAEHFAARAAKRFGLKPQRPTTADLALLCTYTWPGNIRELISVIDRAAILGNGERLDVTAALGGRSHGSSLTSERRPSPTPPHSHVEVSPLDAVIKQHIETALTITHGRVEGPQGAAAFLRINPHTLRARMRKLNIDWAAIRVAARRSSDIGNRTTSERDSQNPVL